MGFNYNGRFRPKELLLRTDGSVELIRREETVEDYFATLDLNPMFFLPAVKKALDTSLKPRAHGLTMRLEMDYNG